MLPFFFLAATFLTTASAFREHLDLDKKMFADLVVNASTGMQGTLSDADGDEQASAEVISATFAAIKLAADLYHGYRETKEIYEEYSKRREAIESIVNGHTTNVASMVRAAHIELGQFSGGAKELQAIIDGDTFNHFKDLLFVFEEAHEMCIGESGFFHDPVAWFVRKFQKDPTTEQIELLRQAKELIEEVLAMLREVMDHLFCPHLKRAIKEDLQKAQLHVEKWEDAVREGTKGSPVSYYELMYQHYVGEDKSAQFFAGMATKVMDKAASYSRKAEYPGRTQCYRTQQGQGQDTLWKEGTFDRFELRFDESFSNADVMRIVKQLRNSSAAIQQHMDQASMNLEMFTRECKRSDPDGREDLIKELQEEGKKGEQAAQQAFVAATCDSFLRYGTREISVLDIVSEGYAVWRFGIERLIVKASKKLLPGWMHKIIETAHHLDHLRHPLGHDALEFYVAVVFLFAKGKSNHNARDTCISMGLALERQGDVEATLDHAVAEAEED